MRVCVYARAARVRVCVIIKDYGEVTRILNYTLESSQQYSQILNNR